MSALDTVEAVVTALTTAPAEIPENGYILEGMPDEVLQVAYTVQDAIEISQYFQLDMEAIQAGRNKALEFHNKKRELHEGTNPMILNKHANRRAQDWADKIAAGEEYGYDPENRVCGENIVLINLQSDLDYMTLADFQHTGEDCVNRWYQQIEDYDFENHTNLNNKKVGSFTQLIWKTSQILGVGIALEKDGNYIVVVCRYFQEGNIVGQRAQQVGQLIESCS
ncbi:Oidioi.mRNA.OKI2018_I69.chr1.g1479.t1.cds [Oikopleura dioica]|uniref:Oidioi.mRNA.OKI2018_I69.chr1.g1479.t1.cds n=1 Tax=Oikopleura dioica TaxID=34765 RepID=A0ABN7STA5_OIKDI|nr:Oidioi.mRNA.OKI2018_I69.chr1.g1479.t1.cds [Oikopleura dioica]